MSLKRIYENHKFSKFTIGQSQKWLNMAIKYIRVCGEDEIPGFDCIYSFCHVPLDNLILYKFNKLPDFPALKISWSRINDYRQYFQIQKWIRDNFEACPLDLELVAWMRKDFDFKTCRKMAVSGNSLA